MLHSVASPPPGPLISLCRKASEPHLSYIGVSTAVLLQFMLLARARAHTHQFSV